jgi:hypothetical protein
VAVIGVTASLEYEVGSGWAAVPNLKSLSFPEISVGEVETTHLGISDFARTYAPGLVNGGNINFECAYTSATMTALNGLLRDEIGWRVSAPTGTSDVYTCDGFLTALSTTFTPDDSEVMISGTVKLTGLPALT